MTTVNLGLIPFAITVTLPRDADFATTLVNDVGDWESGLAIELRFLIPNDDPVVWPATISGPNASWVVDAAAVAAVIDAKPIEVRLHYVTNNNDLLWGTGFVRVS